MGADETVGTSNFKGTDYIVINATTPDDDGQDAGGEGAQKKKAGSQKKFELAI